MAAFGTSSLKHAQGCPKGFDMGGRAGKISFEVIRRVCRSKGRKNDPNSAKLLPSVGCTVVCNRLLQTDQVRV